jgi:hypothetical protein
MVTCGCVLVCAAMHTIGVEKCCNEKGAFVRFTDHPPCRDVGPAVAPSASGRRHPCERDRGVVDCAAIRFFERAYTNAACDYDPLTRPIPLS